MGIYNRDYIREDRPGMLRADDTVIPWIIGLNVLIFLVDRASQGQVNRLFALSLDNLYPRPEVWRLVTYGFCHGDTGHIFFNMFSLWLFGRFVEPIYRAREFLAFYLAGIVISGLAFLAIDGAVNESLSTIGASGGVSAVTILTAMHFPTVQILVMFVIPIQLRYLAIIQVLMDVVGLAGGNSGVANSAHLGGAAFAFVYYRNGWRVLNWLPALKWPRWPRRKASVRIYQPEEESAGIISEETVDRLLQKIHEQGEASLTDEERALLVAASKQKKTRRGTRT
ncbi:MAG: rhomboid family intramembrane serine protease [Planctomycetaceae bacterium]|nr:rhomboid family intramembrane serine protease [Planctomycetaceae bacterium]